ncbi:hypothetical protein MTR67_049346 [Solanum verrucosum]|uniref:Uncharacterized protein n=1 Tax=Solanum verrucosum TaxID=315347 RepID=A0AAF0V397_SOLVR|nr:hypothetical protein MTR67_049346 [Solanum verrucosum]
MTSGGELCIWGFTFGGMQKLVREYKTKVSCWDKSFSQGIGVTAPKARKRDKFKARALFL